MKSEANAKTVPKQQICCSQENERRLQLQLECEQESKLELELHS